MKIKPRNTIWLTALFSGIAILCLAQSVYAVAPAVPTGVTALAQIDPPAVNSGLGKIKLQWTDSSTNETHFYAQIEKTLGTFYEINTSPIASTTPGTTGTVYTQYIESQTTLGNLIDNQPYTLRVRAYDSGTTHTSAWVTVLASTFDRTAPIIDITSHTEGSTYYTQDSITISGTASDAHSGLPTNGSGIQYRVTATAYDSGWQNLGDITPTAWSKEFSATNGLLPEHKGEITIQVKAVDNLSNYAEANIKVRFNPWLKALTMNKATLIANNSDTITATYELYSHDITSISRALILVNYLDNGTGSGDERGYPGWYDAGAGFAEQGGADSYGNQYIELVTGSCSTTDYSASDYKQFVFVWKALNTYGDMQNDDPNYYYSCFSEAWNSGWIEGGDLFDIVPADPSGAAASKIGANTARITWTDNSGATETGFRIERDYNSGGYSFLANAAANGTQYDDATATLPGTYTYRVRAYNSSATPSGWSTTGGVVMNDTPTCDSVSPASGSFGASQYYTFTTKYSDLDGYNNIQYVHILINTAVSGSNCIYGYYNLNTNLIYLRDSAHTTWGTGYAPGTAQVLSNTQVNLNVANCSVSNNGANELTVNWSVQFKAGWNPGACNFYMYVIDDQGSNTGWLDRGDATIDTAPPTAGITYSPNRAVKAGEVLTITATFNEVMADSPVPKIAISGANTVAAANMAKTDTTHYTYNHTVAAGNGTATVALSVGTDIATNVVTSAPTSGATFTVDNTAPTFTIAYYTDTGLTTALTSNYMKAGTYYIKVTSNEALNAAPTITIGAEGTANDITGAATTLVSGNNYKYTRTIAYDAAAVGTVAEDITITGTDIATNTATNATVAGEKYTDTVAPTAPSQPDLAAVDDTGVSSTDNITQNTGSLTFSGTSAENITIELFDGAVSLGTTTASSGSWTKDVSLTEGSHTITAKATDLAGNVSSASTSVSVTVDITAPTAPTLTDADVVWQDMGVNSADNQQINIVVGAGDWESYCVVVPVAGAGVTASGNISVAQTYVDGGVYDSQTAQYKIRSYDAAGNYADSSTISEAIGDRTAPTAPTLLDADVTWVDAGLNTADAQSVNIVVGTGDWESYCNVVAVSGNGTTTSGNISSAQTYTDTGVYDSQTAQYKIRSYDTAGNYADSSTISEAIGDRTAPTAPTLLDADVTWVDAGLNTADAQSVNIVVGTGDWESYCNVVAVSGNGTTTSGNISSAQTYTDTGVYDSQTAQYKIRSYDTAGNYADSSTISEAIGDRTAPTASTGFTATVQTDQLLNSELGRVTFTWTNPGSDFNHVDLRRATGDYPAYNTGTSIYSSNGTSYNDTGLSDNTKYYYKIWTYDASGNYCASPQSATAITSDRTKPATPNLGLVESNCVGYWSFDNSSALGKDYSAYGSNGTNYGATSVAGVSSNALSFNGTSSYFRTATIPASDSFAISIWFKTTSVRDGDRLYWGYGTNRAILANSGTAGKLTWYVQTATTNTGYQVTNNSFVLNEWNNVVLQYTGSQVQCFINGVQDSITASITGKSDTSAFNLGTNYNNTSNWYNGIIDEVRIYNRTLTAAEINSQYSSGLNYVKLSVKPGDSNLKGYWNFDENGGVYAYDTSGNGNNGTITGATWTASGKYSNALSFNGTSDFVGLTRFTLPTGLTLGAWVKTTSTDSAVDYAGNAAQNILGDSTGGVFIGFGVHGGKVRYNHYTASWQSVTGTVSVNDGNWHYIAVTHNQSTGAVALFVDGNIDVTGTVATYNASAGVNRIGGGYLNGTGTGDLFTGTIDGVRIYSSTLTERQVRDIYTNDAPKYTYYRAPASSGVYENVTQLVTNGNAETGTTLNWTSLTGVASTDSYTGGYSFYREGDAAVLSSDYIPIDLNKSYSLEGYFKSYGTGSSKLYFGYAPYDKNKNFISYQSIGIVGGTQTTLYAACSSSDKIVKIVNGTNWYVLSYGYMAFDIDDSGSYNDLPNFNLSNTNIIRVQNMGSYWEIEFNTTVGKTYPIGTKVRMHTAGGTYMYEAAAGASVPASWTKYSATTSGENLYGSASGHWRRGTKYARIMMLANYGQAVDYKLRIDDVSLTPSAGILSTNNYADTFGGFYDKFSSTNSALTYDIGSGVSINSEKLRIIGPGTRAWGSYYYVTDQHFSRGNGFIVETDAKGVGSKGDYMFGVFDSGSAYSYTNMLYAMFAYTEFSQFKVYENGTDRGLYGPTLSADTDYHLKIIVKSGGGAKYYVNGALIYDSSFSTEDNLRIGYTVAAQTQDFDNLCMTPLGTNKGDAQAPLVPAFYASDATDGSASHNISAWSNDNTIDFGWTEPLSNGDDYYYYLSAADSNGNIIDSYSSSNVVTNTNLDTGWSKGYCANILWNDINPPPGIKSQVVSFQDADTDAYGYWYCYGDYAPQADGTNYTVSLWVKTDQATNVSIKFYTADNSETNRYNSEYLTVNSSEGWKLLVWNSFTEPTPTDSDSLSFNFSGFNAGSRLWLCAPHMEATAQGTFVKTENVITPIAGYYWAVNRSATPPSSGWTWVARTTTSKTDVALSPDANDHYMHVKAEDGAGNLSSVRTYGPFYIDATAPAGALSISFSNISTTGMNVTGAALTDATQQQEFYEFDCTTSATWDRARTENDNINECTGMSVNTQYTFKYQGSDGVVNYTAWSGTYSKYTLCNVPSAPTLTALSTTSIRAAINENGNPTNTTFSIKVGSQYVQAGYTLGASAVYQTKTAWGNIDITGLSADTQYTVYVDAKNGDGTATAYSSPASKYTLCANADVVETSSRLTDGTCYEGDGFTFVFSSANLTSGAINYYKYKWDTSASTSASDGTMWSSGTISLPNGTYTKTNSKTLYLHVIAYNGDNVANAQGTIHYGPYFHINTSRKLKHGKWFDDDGVMHTLGN